MTPEPLPLADAQRRNRPPGRPRKALLKGHEAGHVGATVSEVAERPRLNRRAESAGVQSAPSPSSAVAVEPIPRAVVIVPPRLLSLEDGGRYLGGLSAWTLREMVEAGLLHPVALPGPSGKRLRRVVLDRAELDALVERWRRAP